jgi:hypothetical protein
MKILSIDITNFLSFKKFVWPRLDPHLTIIVGPNGAGKTNLFHALRAVQDSVLSLVPGQPAPTHPWAWSHLAHQGDDRAAIRIALDLDLTTAGEHELFASFLAAALRPARTIQQLLSTKQHQNLSPAGMAAFVAWLAQQVPALDLSWLFPGRLTITLDHDGRVRSCQYEAPPDAPALRWNLMGPSMSGQGSASARINSLFAFWHDRLPLAEQARLEQALTGAAGGSFPDRLELADPLPSTGLTVAIHDLSPDDVRGPLVRCLNLPEPGPGRYYGGAVVWGQLLKAALVFTNNVRLPLPEATGNDLSRSDLDLSSGRDLVAFLWQKKNGDAADRADWTGVQQLFRDLTGLDLELVTRAGPDRTGLQTFPVVVRSWGEIPLAFSGAGIAEALFLSTIIAGEKGLVVLLDEPALNLHPTMQTNLLRAIQQQRTNQFLLATHAPALVPADKITSVSRFFLDQGSTRRAALQEGIDGLDRLKALLRRSTDARALLFSKGVILVEGDTELAALSLWWSLERESIAIYPVDGKGNFALMVRLLRHFGVPWAALCDGDTIKDKQQGDQYIRNILRACDTALPKETGSEDFSSLCTMLEPYGIFTLADNEREAFERVLREHEEAAQQEIGSKNKVHVARSIAETHPCPQEVADLGQRIKRHLARWHMD